jgi:H+-translocating NAD(P) transhydrogenase subunit alpha
MNRILFGLLVACVLTASLAPSCVSATDSDGPPATQQKVTTPTTEDESPATIDYWSMLFVFVLATFIGLGVIGRVSRLLHTPLMSLTNAISAIAIVGSIVVTGSDYPAPIRMLGAIALFASMTNIVSGFLITDRMLKMFRQTRAPAPAGETGASSSPAVPPAT